MKMVGLKELKCNILKGYRLTMMPSLTYWLVKF